MLLAMTPAYAALADAVRSRSTARIRSGELDYSSDVSNDETGSYVSHHAAIRLPERHAGRHRERGPAHRARAGAADAAARRHHALTRLRSYAAARSISSERSCGRVAADSATWRLMIPAR